MALAPEMEHYMEAFLAEADEEIAHLQTCLDRLNREGAKLVIVEEAARATANLKSAAATMGFTAVRDLSYATMDMLNAWRRGSVKDPHVSLDLLSKALVKLSEAVKMLREGQGPQASAADLMLQLRALVTEEAENPWPEAEQVVVADPSERRFIIKLSLDTPCQHPVGRYLVCQGYLIGLGRVIAADPPPGETQILGDFSLRYLLATTQDLSGVKATISGIPHVRKLEITPAPSELQALPPEAKGTRKKPVFQDWTVHVEAQYLDDLGEISNELAQIRSGYRTLENELFSINPGLAFRFTRLGDRLEYPIRQLTEFTAKLQKIPAEYVINRLTAWAQEKAKTAGKEIEIKAAGGEITLGSEQAEELLLPLQRLLQYLIENCAQGLEERSQGGKKKANRLEIKFTCSEAKTTISLSVDGKGMDLERDFGPGGHLAEIRREFETRHAMLEGQTWPEQGTLLTLEVAPPGDYISVLSVAVGQEYYALPLHTVMEARRATDDLVVRIDGRSYLPQSRDMIPILDLTAFLGKQGQEKGGYWLFIRINEQRLILRVPAIMGPRQVSLRSGVPVQLPALNACSDNNGQVYFLIDLEILVKNMGKGIHSLAKTVQGAKK